MYTQRVAQATAADQAALTKCSVSDAKSMDQMLYQQRKNRVEADQGKEWSVSPVSPSTTGSQATIASPEASTTMQTRRPRGRPTPWSDITLYHFSRQVDYQMSVVSLHKDPVGRLLREGVDIVAGNQTILLNSKEEFLQGAVPSTRTQRGFGR